MIHFNSQLFRTKSPWIPKNALNGYQLSSLKSFFMKQSIFIWSYFLTQLLLAHYHWVAEVIYYIVSQEPYLQFSLENIKHSNGYWKFFGPKLGKCFRRYKWTKGNSEFWNFFLSKRWTAEVIFSDGGRFTVRQRTEFHFSQTQLFPRKKIKPFLCFKFLLTTRPDGTVRLNNDHWAAWNWRYDSLVSY